MYTLIFLLLFLCSHFYSFLADFSAATMLPLALSISTFIAWLLCFDALFSMFQHGFFLVYYLPLTPLLMAGWFETIWHFGLDYLT